MLNVKTPEEVLSLIETEFDKITQPETVSLADAMLSHIDGKIAALGGYTAQCPGEEIPLE